MKKVNLIIAAMLSCICLAMPVHAEGIYRESFENGTEGFGIAYGGSGIMPSLYTSDSVCKSGTKSLELVTGSSVTDNEYISSSAKSFEYQGIRCGKMHSVQKNQSYISSGFLYTAEEGVNARIMITDGNKPVSVSEKFTLEANRWNYIHNVWNCEKSSDKISMRIVFTNVRKNASIYADDVSSYPDFLRAGGFENGIDGWAADEEANAECSSEKSVGGEYSLKMNIGKEALEKGAGISQSVDMQRFDKNKEYVITAKVYTDEENVYAKLFCENSPNFSNERTVIPGKWNLLTASFKPSGINSESIVFRVQFQGDVSGDSEFYVDDVSIRDEEAAVGISEDGGKLKISGKLRSGNENRKINVAVYDENSGSTILNDVVTTDGTGAYNCICDVSGTEKARLNTVVKITDIMYYDEYKNQLEGGYVYVNNDKIAEYVRRIANAKTESEIRAVLDDADAKETLDLNSVAAFRNNTNPSVVYETILNSRIESYADLKEAVTVGSAIDIINNSHDDFFDTVNTYYTNLGLDKTEGYAEYTAFDSRNKEILRQCYYEKEQSVHTPEEMCGRFREAVLKKEIREKKVYSQVIEILRRNSDFLNIDFAKYDSGNISAQNKYSIEVELAKYAAAAKDITVLNSKLTELMQKYRNNSGGSGTGGTGGGSGTGSSGKTVTGTFTVKNGQIYGSESDKYEFSDVAEDFWGYASIYELADMDIISKPEDKMFRPENEITREEFAKMTVKAFNIQNGSECTFTDVEKDAWYYEYVSALQSAEIVTGYEDNTFGAGKSITREEVCVILYRIVESRQIDIKEAENKNFSDEGLISEYAANGIKALTAAGVVSGYENGEFKPHNSITRAETAKIISGLLKLIK